MFISLQLVASVSCLETVGSRHCEVDERLALETGCLETFHM